VTDCYDPHIVWARLVLRRVVVAALLGLVLLVALDVGTALAQPILVSPANGASFARNASIAFTVEQAPGATDTEIYLGSSPAIDEDGNFAEPVSSFIGFVDGGSSGTATWSPSDQAAGTYYWDASSFVCNSTFCGYMVSAVQSIVLTPLPAPAPVSPANGATQGFSSSTRFVFIPNAQPDDTAMELVFSASNAVAPDGVLAQPSYTTADLTNDETSSTRQISVRIPPALDTPGTLYWQPVRANCDDNPTPPCDVPGPVSMVTLTNKLAITLEGNTTVRIGDPRISWTVSCNEACSGKAGVTATDSHFDVRPARFSLKKAGKLDFSHTYRGTTLAQLVSAVKVHGDVSLKVVASASSTSGGGKANASRKISVHPNPPPPGPDAALSYSGDGSLNLGPVTVPVASYMFWSCAGCTIFTVESDPDSSLDNIFVDTFEQSSGETYVDAGTYPNVQVFSDGSWAIDFAPAD
jgi:hypothetical protein